MGTVYAKAPWFTKYSNIQYREFDGTNDYLMSHADKFDNTGDLSIIAVIKPDDGIPVNPNMIVTKIGPDPNIGYYFYLDISGRIYFVSSHDGTNQNLNGTFVLYSDGAQSSFTFVGATHSGTDGTVKIYKDGQEKPLDASASNATIYDTKYPFMIGAWGFNASERFDGKIALVIIFNRVLTDGEIAKIYHACQRDGIVP